MSNYTPEELAFLKAASVKPVPITPFEEYAEKYKDVFALRREDGICEIRMHANGGTPVFATAHHAGLGQIINYAQNDPENEVLIITSTGDRLCMETPNSITQLMRDMKQKPQETYERYKEGYDLVQAIVNTKIPTIGAINGPADGMLWLSLCDITVCSDTATMCERHFGVNIVPADGNLQTLIGLCGLKKGSYLGYMGKEIDAQMALDLGLVSEVVPFEKVNDRAWEIARYMMTRDKYVRRLTHHVVRGYYQNLVKDISHQLGTEFWGHVMANADYEDEQAQKAAQDSNEDKK